MTEKRDHKKEIPNLYYLVKPWIKGFKNFNITGIWNYLKPNFYFYFLLLCSLRERARDETHHASELVLNVEAKS